MKLYPFIEVSRRSSATSERACELLEVSRAASDAHRVEISSVRQLADDELTERIRQVHQASKVPGLEGNGWRSPVGRKPTRS